MKIRVSLTIDIDPESWELNYGVPKSQMREDVREYVQHLVGEQLRQAVDEEARVTLNG